HAIQCVWNARAVILCHLGISDDHRGDDISSTVTVKMNTCSRTHKVTATLRDDGNIDIHPNLDI
ncbi:MAG: hypothetical protein WCS15_10360, partial [Prevotella sp.]